MKHWKETFEVDRWETSDSEDWHEEVAARNHELTSGRGLDWIRFQAIMGWLFDRNKPNEMSGAGGKYVWIERHLSYKALQSC